MSKLLSFIFLSILFMSQSMAQELPLREIPPAPETYSSGTVLARMVEGLGFRYYWASEGLRTEDLAYQPEGGGRSCRATLEHILNLAEGIYYTSKGEGIQNTRDWEGMSYEEIRKQTLEKLAAAAKNFRAMSDEEIAKLKIKFGKNAARSFDLWLLINGQIADGIYHSGQVVSFRRSAGNPINPNISVFQGKVRE